jgi:hypothetical protein
LLLVRHLIWYAYQIRYFAGARRRQAAAGPWEGVCPARCIAPAGRQTLMGHGWRGRLRGFGAGHGGRVWGMAHGAPPGTYPSSRARQPHRAPARVLHPAGRAQCRYSRQHLLQECDIGLSRVLVAVRVQLLDHVAIARLDLIRCRIGG